MVNCGNIVRPFAIRAIPNLDPGCKAVKKSVIILIECRHTGNQISGVEAAYGLEKMTVSKCSNRGRSALAHHSFPFFRPFMTASSGIAMP